MKRRIAALAACLLLLLPLRMPVPAQAAESFYFVAASENVLPLSDDTMPFWHNGYLYIASSMFTGATRDSLDVSCSRNDGRNLVMLYRRGRSLFFNTKTLTVEDAEGVPYAPGPVEKNGTIFVPAGLVASFFELDYTVAKVERGHLVWLRQKDFGMSEGLFVNAAAYPMESRYQQYMKNREPAAGTEEPPVTPPEEVPQGNQRIFLCLTASDNLGELLDELERRRMGAAVFCTPAYMEAHGGLLRRMVAGGYAVGVEADTWEELEAGNEILERETMSRTRFARMSGAEDAERDAAKAAGWCLVEPELDRSGYGLRTMDNAGSLMQQLYEYSGAVTVQLGPSVSAAGLRMFFNLTEAAGDRCMTLTESLCR